MIFLVCKTVLGTRKIEKKIGVFLSCFLKNCFSNQKDQEQ